MGKFTITLILVAVLQGLCYGFYHLASNGIAFAQQAELSVFILEHIAGAPIFIFDHHSPWYLEWDHFPFVGWFAIPINYFLQVFFVYLIIAFVDMQLLNKGWVEVAEKDESKPEVDWHEGEETTWEDHEIGEGAAEDGRYYGVTYDEEEEAEEEPKAEEEPDENGFIEGWGDEDDKA